MMWELVYADGQVSEFEDNVVWRAADLLGISRATGSISSIACRAQAAASAGRRRPTRPIDGPASRRPCRAHDETLMWRDGHRGR
jgi:hypothetical protein